MEASSLKAEESMGHALEKEMKEFEETKAGVKGLVDSGVARIPRIFVNPPEASRKTSINNTNTHLQVPSIDFAGLQSKSGRRAEIVEEIREAAETWGFFQMINHGVPMNVMEAMLEGVRGFHEQPSEAKRELYSRIKSVTYFSNEECEKSKCWRDSLSVQFLDDALQNPEMIPPVCRLAVEEYMKNIMKLKETIAELLSEALGLNNYYLSRMECMRSGTLVGHYYPSCPEPHMTQGISPHSDLPFLTILLQDDVGGLQVLHQNHWVDLHPMQGSLIANIGDLMQLVSNDKFKSVEHRVLTASAKARVSVACFLYQGTRSISKPIGPLKELLSSKCPIYKEVTFAEYVACYRSNRNNNFLGTLSHFKL